MERLGLEGDSITFMLVEGGNKKSMSEMKSLVTDNPPILGRIKSQEDVVTIDTFSEFIALLKEGTMPRVAMSV